jgi:hypothetical protein
MNRDRDIRRIAPEASVVDDMPEFARFSSWLREHEREREREIARPGAGTLVSEWETGKWSAALVTLAMLWKIVELPVEYWLSTDGMERATVALSTAIWIAISALVLKGNATARGVLVFLCALGVLVVAPALPMEYETFRLAFWLSLVECVLKCIVFVAFLSRYIQT